MKLWSLSLLENTLRYTLFLTLLPVTDAFSQVKPLPNAHAHNDYEHERPLQDALNQGFTSVEADIHLVNGELYVSHDAPDLSKAKTLRELYLTPLQQRMKQHKGRIYPDYQDPLVVLVDIKTEAEATYQVLRQQLARYKEMLVRTENGKRVQGSVWVILSGNRPTATVQRETEALVAIDGRPDDLSANYANIYMPLISYNFRSLVKWNGQGDIAAEDRTILQKLADSTHAQGKKLRLWATPENEKVWETLLTVGVDYLNTDQLERLQRFLQNKAH